jgi:hypothetical protein
MSSGTSSISWWSFDERVGRLFGRIPLTHFSMADFAIRTLAVAGRRVGVANGVTRLAIWTMEEVTGGDFPGCCHSSNMRLSDGLCHKGSITFWPVSRPRPADAVNRRGLRPTIGVQCGPSVAAYNPFVDNLKMPSWVGPSWAPMLGQSSRPIYTLATTLRHPGPSR